MVTPSVLSTGVFVAIVVVVTATVVYALRRAGAGSMLIMLVITAYLVAPAVLARAGLLDRYSPMPAPALLMVLALFLTTLALTLSGPANALLRVIPLGAVIAFQAFRIPVEWFLHRLHVEGVLPVEMTYAGRNFDIVSGILGLILGAWLLSGRRVHRGMILAWNIAGLLLLVNIIGIAVLSTPVPFRRFVDGPPNLLPSTFPFVWLPSFLVQVALASHLLVFRYVARQRPD